MKKTPNVGRGIKARMLVQQMRGPDGTIITMTAEEFRWYLDGDNTPYHYRRRRIMANERLMVRRGITTVPGIKPLMSLKLEQERQCSDGS